MTIWQRMASVNLSVWVILGALLGILCGVFFGPYATVLEPIGSVYVMLLQMAVFPFVISSLIHGLGSLSPTIALRLLKSGALFFVIAWGGVFVALWVLAQAIPEARPPVVVRPGGGAKIFELISLLIPSNPFADLTSNYVPAIVVFSVFYGIAIQGLKSKQSLLETVDVIRRASATIWRWVVRIAPFGVFALFADLAGTVEIQSLGGLVLYAILFVGGALILALWVIPSLIAAIAPIGYGELMKELQTSMVVAVVTSLPITAVPLIIQMVEKLVERHEIVDENRKDIVHTTIAVSYPVAQLGNLFVILFMAFAAFYYDSALPGTAWITLPILTLLSTVGTPVSTVDAVAFLANWLGMPAESELLYVEMMTLTRYPQVLVSTMGLAFVTILVPFAYYGMLKIRPAKVAVSLVVGLVLLGGLAWAGQSARPLVAEKQANPYLRFTLDRELTKSVDAEVHRDDGAQSGDQGSAPDSSGGATMDRIRNSGTLRVGYGPHVIPFSYFNASGDLVGHDIDIVYAMARDLDVKLELYPITNWESLSSALEKGRFDIAVGGVYVSEDRLRKVAVSQDYLKSPPALIVRSGDTDEFLGETDTTTAKDLRIAVFKSDIIVPLAHRSFPKAEIGIVPDYDSLLADDSFDAALWTLYQAKAWAEANPGFSAVVPDDLGGPLSMAFLMPPNSPVFERYVNGWLALQRDNGFLRRIGDYWLKGEPRSNGEPRWSIIRNVLHWLE